MPLCLRKEKVDLWLPHVHVGTHVSTHAFCNKLCKLCKVAPIIIPLYYWGNRLRMVKNFWIIVCVHTHMFGEQRTSCRSWFSCAIMRVIRLGSKHYLQSHLTSLSVQWVHPESRHNQKCADGVITLRWGGWPGFSSPYPICLCSRKLRGTLRDHSSPGSHRQQFMGTTYTTVN